MGRTPAPRDRRVLGEIMDNLNHISMVADNDPEIISSVPQTIRYCLKWAILCPLRKKWFYQPKGGYSQHMVDFVYDGKWPSWRHRLKFRGNVLVDWWKRFPVSRSDRKRKRREHEMKRAVSGELSMRRLGAQFRCDEARDQHGRAYYYPTVSSPTEGGNLTSDDVWEMIARDNEKWAARQGF